MGLSHLEAERPCDGFGKSCGKCRLREWCLLYQQYRSVMEKERQK